MWYKRRLEHLFLLVRVTFVNKQLNVWLRNICSIVPVYYWWKNNVSFAGCSLIHNTEGGWCFVCVPVLKSPDWHTCCPGRHCSQCPLQTLELEAVMWMWCNAAKSQRYASDVFFRGKYETFWIDHTPPKGNVHSRT